MAHKLYILLPPGEHDPGRLRFINYTYIFASAGRLEIYLNGHWGTICGVGFGSEDAILACNQLGYRTYRRYGTVGQLGWVIRVIYPGLYVWQSQVENKHYSYHFLTTFFRLCTVITLSINNPE